LIKRRFVFNNAYSACDDDSNACDAQLQPGAVVAAVHVNECAAMAGAVARPVDAAVVAAIAPLLCLRQP
jgi:hypothetical protein